MIISTFSSSWEIIKLNKYCKLMIKIVDQIKWKDSYSVLAKTEYLRSSANVVKYGYFVDDELVLPFVIKKKSIFSWMQLVTEVMGADDGNSADNFLEECIKLGGNIFGISHVVTVNTALFKNYPQGSVYCKWGSYKVDLSLTEEELFSNLHSKHRNVIRKAESLGSKVDCGREYANDAVALMNDTYNRQAGKHGIDSTFVNRMTKLGKNVDWWVVKDSEGNLQGSAIFVWSTGASCYYMHGGSSAHTSPGAMNYLIWKAMLEMKRRGVKIFDFVGARLTTEPGSKLEGIQRFKSRFGSTLNDGYMFRYVYRPFKYWLYTQAMKTYAHIHHEHYSDIIMEERKKGNL